MFLKGDKEISRLPKNDANGKEISLNKYDIICVGNNINNRYFVRKKIALLYSGYFDIKNSFFIDSRMDLMEINRDEITNAND